MLGFVVLESLEGIIVPSGAFSKSVHFWELVVIATGLPLAVVQFTFLNVTFPVFGSVTAIIHPPRFWKPNSLAFCVNFALYSGFA